MPTSSKKILDRQKKRFNSFINRRPHRTFRLTRRRDYVRPLVLPGYFSFTHEVTKLLWKNRKTFALLAVIYIFLYAVLVGMQSQDDYTTLGETLKTTGGDLFTGGWGAISQAGVLLMSEFSSGYSAQSSEAQQIFSVVIFLMAWLTTVWLLRNILAGHKVKLRDGLYNSGAPIFSTILIALLVAVQLIPIAIAFVGYSAALSSGLLAGGVASMLFWLSAGLLAVLSLYWITSTLFAMVIITLPGMYPYQAIKTAGDIMLGRRIKILFRWVWMALVVIVVSVIVLIPIILLDMGLKSLWPTLQGLPIVPIALLVWSALMTIWVASYVYLLYRKVVDYAPR